MPVKLPSARPPSYAGGAVTAALAAIAALVPVLSGASDRGALWGVVHDICVPDMKLRQHPTPCVKADLARGYVVVPDLESPAQLLLVPTVRLTGIEDPKLLAPGAPNYWSLSWENRQLLEQRIGRPLRRNRIGVVVNSLYGRSQDQLHLHIDCLRGDVAGVLAVNVNRLGSHWRPLGVSFGGHRYLARWINGADLSTTDPFRLLAERPSARRDMGLQTLALVGATSPRRGPGFVLLANTASRRGRDEGHGEELLDHSCRSDG